LLDLTVKSTPEEVNRRHKELRRYKLRVERLAMRLINRRREGDPRCCIPSVKDPSTLGFAGFKPNKPTVREGAWFHQISLQEWDKAVNRAKKIIASKELQKEKNSESGKKRMSTQDFMGLIS